MHYYQFNIGNYRRRTNYLTPLEHGVYRLLIDTYYLTETGLNSDHAILMRTHSFRTADEVQAMENVLHDFFILDDGVYKHCHCDVEIAKYHAKSEKASASARARWDKNANAKRTHSEGNANHKPITNNHKPITNNQYKPKEEAKIWLAPDWINGDAWIEFEEHRNHLKKPLSNLSRTKAANVLQNCSFNEQQEIIDKSIQSGWAGLFPLKEKSNGKPNISEEVSRLANRL